MLVLVTGKPGASKSLNTLASIVESNNADRPIFYTNVRLLMLDYQVASSFSGWFYGNYLLRLKNKPARKRLDKVIKRVHADDEFVKLSDVPWLESFFEASKPLDTWLYWVRKLYSKKQLSRMEEFISNMPTDALTFDHLAQFNLHFTHFVNARDWYTLPKTSIILIDECQQYFPPRPAGSTVPIHISKYETHRHDGFDVYLVTQDRMLLDSNVRKLVNRHIHFHNAFGGNRVTRYQQSKSFDVDNYFDLQSTQKSLIKRPTHFYGSYFSSEMHTHKFQLPKAFYVLIFLILMVGYLVYSFLTSSLFSGAEVKKDVLPVAEISQASKRVSLVDVRSTLPSTEENKVLSDFVISTVDGVFISGSQYVKLDSGEVRYDYSFVKKESGEIFDPSSVGFVVHPVTDCLARLNFYDYTTFITCNPFHKFEPIQENNELVASL
jgi:zona occludens toxin